MARAAGGSPQRVETPQPASYGLSTLVGVGVVCLAVGVFAGMILARSSREPGPATPPGRSAPPRSAAPAPSQAPAAAAIPRLVDETTQNPGNVDAWTMLGNAYFDTDQFDRAIAAYQESLRLKPGNANVLTDMGVMYRRSGRPEEALKAFAAATAANPHHEVSRMNAGIVLMNEMNDPQGAIEAFEGLLAANPAAAGPDGRPLGELVEKLKAKLREAGEPG